MTMVFTPVESSEIPQHSSRTWVLYFQNCNNNLHHHHHQRILCDANRLPGRLQGRCHAIVVICCTYCTLSVFIVSPYERRNNSVFNNCLNWSNKDKDDVIDGGRLFQTFAVATVKALSPMVLCLVRGTWSSAVDAERSRLRELMSVTRCNPASRYCGAKSIQSAVG